MNAATAIPEISVPSREVFESQIRPAMKPVIMRGLTKDWPCVDTALSGGAEALFGYLKNLDNRRPQNTLIGDAEIGGRFTYSQDLRSQNFETQAQSFSQVFDDLLQKSEDGKARFIQSALAHNHVPDFVTAHRMPLAPAEVRPRFWIGNQTTVQTHFDLSENIACVVLGQRDFTLFPPDQMTNLYPGPLETAPGQIPVSLTSLENPDFETHPKFKEALKHRMTATLNPGDALYIPPGWWHHVKAKAPLNMLVNYWWSAQKAQLENQYAALFHGMMAFKSLSKAERNIWKNMFDNFIFETEGEALAHIPPHSRGFLGGVPENLRTAMIYDILTALAKEVGLPPPPRPKQS